MDLRFVQIPKIDNDILLEELCKDLFKADNSLGNVNIHGRPGQKQDGIDVYARHLIDNIWIGAQCKVRSTNIPFTKEMLLSEVNQAIKFNPKISKYYLYTTLNRDTTTQGFLREISDELAVNNQFTFEILFWEDIEEALKRDENQDVYYRYYHSYFRDNTALGHSIGKLINLELYFGNIPDSHYEIMIGKIPDYENKTRHNVDYFRNTYYISNLQDKTIEFFTKSQSSNKAVCFESDIEDAFSNNIDRYRITKWIQSIENLDELIYNDIHNYKFSITQQERHEFEKDEFDFGVNKVQKFP
ncbi:MAG: hypothetical protein WCK67_08405 [bacterium]